MRMSLAAPGDASRVSSLRRQEMRGAYVYVYCVHSSIIILGFLLPAKIMTHQPMCVLYYDCIMYYNHYSTCVLVLPYTLIFVVNYSYMYMHLV